MVASQKHGYFLGDDHYKVENMLGSILGSPYLVKGLGLRACILTPKTSIVCSGFAIMTKQRFPRMAQRRSLYRNMMLPGVWPGSEMILRFPKPRACFTKFCTP